MRASIILFFVPLIGILACSQEGNIEGYAGVKLGGDLPSGDPWFERDGMVVQMDTLSTDPQMPFGVAIAPHEEKVGYIAVTKSILKEDLLSDWGQQIRELTAEYGPPDTLVQQPGELQFTAAWTDKDGDQIAAIAMPAHAPGRWHIVVGYSWHKAVASRE